MFIKPSVFLHLLGKIINVIGKDLRVRRRNSENTMCTLQYGTKILICINIKGKTFIRRYWRRVTDTP